MATFNTVVDTALREALRTLNLSGMLETLDARLVQASAGELGHLDFLQVLCHDEIARRDSQAMQRRLRRAKFEAPATLEEFELNGSSRTTELAFRRWPADPSMWRGTRSA